MANENITKAINEASGYIEQVEQLGVMGLNMADGILNNCRSFVHDPVMKKKISDHEEKIFTDFQKKIDEARKELKDSDPLFSWQDGMSYYMNMRLWKTQEMLSFWDKINNERENL